MRAFRQGVHARAPDVLAAAIDPLARWPVPRSELEPLAEMLSTGMASPVLWWIDELSASRTGIIDAMTRLWLRLLSSP